MSPLTAPHFGERRSTPSAGTPLTREEFIVAARLADHLAAQLKELDERESLLRIDLARLLEKERSVLEARDELRQREDAIANRESNIAGLEQAALQLAEAQLLLQSREQELQQREEQFSVLQTRLHAEQARLEQLTQQLRTEQSAGQVEVKFALDSARQMEQVADVRLAEIAALREETARELEAARLKIIEDRVHFEGECARLRRRLEDERQRQEQELDHEATRLRDLRQKVEQSAAALEVQRQQLIEERLGWESERDRLMSELQAQTAKQQVAQSDSADLDKLALERQSAIDEIEKRKAAAKQLLTAQSQALEQLRSDLDRRQAELEQSRADHERTVAQFTDAAKAKAQKLVAGIDDIRREKLAGLDLRETELSRREVDFRKRTQLHEQHLEKVRHELKEQRTQLEKKRQQQRVWVEQIEASIRLRMTQLRKFRDLITAREQALDDERRHLTQMQQSAAYAESQRWMALEGLQEDLVAQGEQLRAWFVAPFQGGGSAGAAAAAVSVMLDLIEKRAADLQDILSLLQAQREQWETERTEAERVIRELVQQLELALDELSRQQTHQSVASGAVAGEQPETSAA